MHGELTLNISDFDVTIMTVEYLQFIVKLLKIANGTGRVEFRLVIHFLCVDLYFIFLDKQTYI